MTMRALDQEAWRLQWRVQGGNSLPLFGDACPNSRVKLVNTKQYLKEEEKKRGRKSINC